MTISEFDEALLSPCPKRRSPILAWRNAWIFRDAKYVLFDLMHACVYILIWCMEGLLFAFCMLKITVQFRVDL